MYCLRYLLAAISHVLLLSSEQTSAHPLFSKTRRNLNPVKEWVPLGNILSEDQSGGAGYSTASSSDGDIIAFGSPFKKNNVGSVQVHKYVDEETGWARMGKEIFGIEHGVLFGRAIALSYDGGILVVASPRWSGGRGAVSVYRFDSLVNDWEKIGADIIGEVELEEFGYSIAVSKRGDYIAIGAPMASRTPGKVRVYRFADEGWEKLGSEIVGEANYDAAGHSVDIMEHDTDLFVAVGANMDVYTDGSASVFKFNTKKKTWDRLGPYVDGDTQGTDFGQSVSLGHDGTNLILAVGFPGPGIDESSEIKSGVQVYSITNDGKWGYYGQMIFPVEENDKTGYKVSLSDDGQTLAIASPEYGEDHGMVRVFYKGKNSLRYNQIGFDLVGDKNDKLGFSMRISRSGRAVTVGSPEGNYVATYKVHGSKLDINSRSALSIVMTTFITIGLIALVIFVAFKTIMYVKHRGVLFTSIPSNNIENQNSEIAMRPVQNIAEADSDDGEGSEVSYEEDDIDYETHLRKIT
jgi:hypothetical protein